MTEMLPVHAAAKTTFVRGLRGPDLDRLPSLEEQLSDLDALNALGDMSDYAVGWILITDSLGGDAYAEWPADAAVDASPSVRWGFACDRQAACRRARHTALTQHMLDTPGAFEAVVAELTIDRRYTDNRLTPPAELKAVVRAFLATGGRLIRCDLRDVEMGLDAVDWLLSPEPVSAPAVAQRFAARAMARICRRWRAQRVLARVVDRLGSNENGWLVLEGVQV